MTADSVPAHQRLLSSLIASLSESGECSVQADPQQQQHHEAKPRFRSLLLTLHVIFPNLVLPALDLIDRQLVARLQAGAETSNEPGNIQAYAVQSLSSENTSRAVPKDTLSRVHIIHLAAWNCSCNDFSRDKFCTQKTGEIRGARTGNACISDSDGLPGGFPPRYTSLNSDHVPCCKHLLACLMAEWTRSRATSTDRVSSKYEIATLVSSV